MNKANFRFKRNISKELSPVIKKYTQLLYKKGLSDNTITHYRCHINRLATFCNVEPDKLTIKNFDKYIEYITFVKLYRTTNAKAPADIIIIKTRYNT